MKNLIIIATVIFMNSCGVKAPDTMIYKNITPKAYHVSQSEKENVNYDFRKNKKLINKNIEEKKLNQKYAVKRREQMEKDLNKLNNASSKVKKNKNYNMEAFNFYH